MPYSTCAISRFCRDQSEVCAVKYGGRCQEKMLAYHIPLRYVWSTAAESSSPTGVRVPKSRAGISYSFFC